MRFLVWVVPLPALVVVLALAACGGTELDTAADEPVVYRLRLAEPPAGECEDPPCEPTRFALWVAPEPGWIRAEWVDETGFATTRVFAHGARATWHTDEPPDVRIGPPSFVAEPPETSAVAAARGRDLSIGDRLTVELGSRRVMLVVDDELPLESAAARRLFAIPTNGVISKVVRPEAPPDAVRAYWLGERFGNRAAVAAVERSGPAEKSYSVFYGNRVPTSAEEYGSPGQLQVVSQPLDDPGARRTLEHVRNRPQMRVSLADGDRARLAAASPTDGAYVVITETTLIGFQAASPTQARRIADALRPAGR